MLDDKAIADAYEKVLIEVPEFTKDMLGIYVTAPLYEDCDMLYMWLKSSF